jgi:hypothetical protein
MTTYPPLFPPAIAGGIFYTLPFHEVKGIDVDGAFEAVKDDNNG